MPVKIPGTHKMAKIEVGTKNSDEYRDGWERIFGKKRKRMLGMRCTKCKKPDLKRDCTASGPLPECDKVNKCDTLCQCEEPSLVEELLPLPFVSEPTQSGGEA